MTDLDQIKYDLMRLVSAAPERLAAVGAVIDAQLRAVSLVPLSAVSLTEEDLVMARSTGTDVGAIRMTKARQADEQRAVASLSIDERQLAQSMGTPILVAAKIKLDSARAATTLRALPETVRLSVMAQSGNMPIRAAALARMQGYV